MNREFESGSNNNNISNEKGKNHPSSLFQNAASSLIEGTRQVIMNAVRVTRSGGSGTRTTMNGHGNNKKPKPVLAGEAESEKMLADAEYEAYQDPYRGLRAGIQSLETGTQVTTPWNACVWGTLEPEQCVESKSLDAVSMVRHVGHCACPTLKAWTRKKLQQQESSAKKGKKKTRKRQRNETTTTESSDAASLDTPVFSIGLRPDDAKYRCPCDYNPLCLATLGGVVNEVLTRRCQATEDSSSRQKETTEEQTGRSTATKVKEEPMDISSPPPAKRVQREDDTAETPIRNNEQQPDHIIIDDDDDEAGEGDSKDKASSAMSVDVVDDKEKGQPDDPFAFPGTTSSTKDTEAAAVVRSTPLKKMKCLKTEDGVTENPADVYFAKEDDATQGDNLSNVMYSAATTEELDRLRGSIDLQSGNIRSYVFRTLCITHEPNDKNGLTTDKYMAILEKWHQSLIFMNPLNPEKRLDGDKIGLSIPPGIENLGATCYLNTQLQCLAQNTVFLNGIFSWRQVNSTHRMNSVMTNLQCLLAQMELGGDSKLSTLNFSNALGLEHDEQQDPNEFARLLFERMDESFQQCAGDLSNLLQRIFHGTATYETVCMTCGHTSERNEGFMDLNLPIVKRPTTKNKGDIKSAFGAGVDTDVQYCLDQYFCAEMLEGDNQYHCSSCDQKRDAKRVLKLTELPPVLNVQLSRYVFDRQQFVKKKLSDKVLLPRTLQVERNGSSKRKYLLCAVMRHQGNSAYQGHYVAEAMDWLTGQWFEFNDAVVKLLPDGPSCSFAPNENGQVGTETNGSKSLVSGSQDAYNMYYVSDTYLAKHAAETALRRSNLVDVGGSKDAGILAEISEQRDAKYAMLSQMCFQDGLVSNRLERRKKGIERYLFNDASSLIPDEAALTGKEDSNVPVWVGTHFLREFLRCDPELDYQLKLPGPILKHEPILCEHGRLNPRTARQGKLLSRTQYTAYVSLLEGERKLLCEQTAEDYQAGPINDCVVTPANNLFCDECAESYRAEFSEKLELVKDVKNLYDAFESLVDGEALEKSEDEVFQCPEDGFAYAVSRPSVTKYKKCVVNFLKKCKDYDEGRIVENGAPGLSGLDTLDVSTFSELRPAEKVDNAMANDDSSPGNATAKPSLEDLDKRFNTNITCSHGNCNVLNNGRSVRFVSWNVWRLLRKVFPEAIEHKKERESSSDAPERDSGCALCQGDKDALELLRSKLAGWAKGTKENFELKALIDGKRTVSRDLDVHNFTCAKNGCRLVHRVDIQTWRKALTTIAASSKTKNMDFDQVREFVESTVFPNTHSVVLDFERQPVERLLASLRSLICRAHKRVIKNAVFKSSPDAEGATPKDPDSSHRLSDGIAVLSDVEYRAYVCSLADLLHILYPEQGSCSMDTDDSPTKISENKPYLRDIELTTDSYHPAINMRVDANQISSDDLLVFSLQRSAKEFQLTPGVCSCHTCAQEFAPLQHRVNFEDDDKIESISVDSGDDSKPPAKKRLGAGSKLSDPIVVESDWIDNYQSSSPDTFPLRVFSVEEKTDLEEAINHLQSLAALPTVPGDNESIGVNFLRRSSRKRQSRFPNGPLLREDSIQVGMHHNLAAVRLLMYEKCEVPLSGRKFSLVLSINDGKAHKTMTLASAQNPKQLSELVESLREGTDPKDAGSFEPSKDLVLLYQRDRDFEASGLHESLMDSFLQMANLDSSEPSSDKKSKKRSRPSERGFRGTLLSSSSADPEGSSPKKDGDSGTNSGDFKDTEKVERKQMESRSVPAPVDISEVSDEEKETKAASAAQPQQVVLSVSDDEIPMQVTGVNRVVDERVEDADSLKSAQAVVEDDSSFESARGDERNRISPGNAGAETIVDSTHVVEQATFDGNLKEFVDLVRSMVEQPPNESACWQAVQSAIEDDPDMSDESELLERALEYYKRNTWGFREGEADV